MKKIFCFLFLGFLLSCVSKYSKDNYITTYTLSDDIYVEKFKTYSGGVFANDSYSYYLTDSVSFRTFIYTIDNDNERMHFEIKNNVVFCYKIALQKTILIEELNINEEKQKGVFE